MFNQTPHKIVQSNRILILIGVFLFLIVLCVFMFKAQVNEKKENVQEQPRQSLDVSPKSIETSWFNEEKFKNIRFNNMLMHKSPAQEDEKQMISSQELALRKQEIEDVYATRLEIKKIEDKNMVEEKKLEIEAMKAPLSIDIPGIPGVQAKTPVKQSAKDGLTGGLDEMINMVKSLTGAKMSTIPSIINQLGGDINNQNGKEAFLKKNDVDDDYLDSIKKKPRSPYEIKAGSYISAALITGINSDLPGNVDAQVIQDVYDTVTGNYVLIPQGARLVGEYNSNLSFGQQRVQVVWNRIIFPDGSSINLARMQGGDISGYTGFHDKVDNHYLRIYGNAVLLSLMGAGYDILNQKAEQSTDPRETVAASVGQKLADVSGQTLQKNMDVQPTVIIGPGYKFKIFVMKDMVLDNIKDAQGTLAYSK